MQFVGFFVWKKNMNEETKEVIKRRMNPLILIASTASIIIATVLYGIFLKYIGDAMPFVD